VGTSINALPQIPVTELPLPQALETTLVLPDALVSMQPLPAAPETPLALPQTGVTVLPSGFVPYFPPELVVEAHSEGTASAVVSGAMFTEVEASGTGTASVDLSPIHYAEAAADSEGTPSVEVTDAKSMDSDATGEGTASVDVVPVTTVEASSSGSADIEIGIDASASSEGTGSAVATMVGLVTAGASSEGTASADLVTFAPSSMKKTTAYAVPTTRTKVPGWNPDTATHPGSSVVSDSLVVQGAKIGAQISASIPYSQNTFNTGRNVYLMHNGVQIATASGGGTSTLVMNATRDVANGDLIWVEAKSSFSGTTIAANTPVVTCV
jgi:hypothetical protein